MSTYISHNSIDVSNIVLCGDFNCELDCQHDRSARKLQNLIDSLDLFDILRVKQNDLNGYTWCNGNDVPFS